MGQLALRSPQKDECRNIITKPLVFRRGLERHPNYCISKSRTSVCSSGSYSSGPPTAPEAHGAPSLHDELLLGLASQG